MGLLSVLLVTVHLLSMNVAAAGPVLSVWLDWRGRHRCDENSGLLAERLARASLQLLVVGILVGTLVGYLAWLGGDDRLVLVLPLFRSRIFWAIWELVCSIVWLAAYWLWLKWAPPRRRWTRFLHRSLAFLSATNLLYHFPPLLTVMSQMATSGGVRLQEPVTSTTFRQLAFTPAVVAHSLHFSLASFAVSGVFLCWLARKLNNSRPFYVRGARVALVATAMQLPVGIWLLMVIPASAQSRLLGGNVAGTGLFLASMLAAFYLTQSLAQLALGEADDKLAARSGCWLLLTVTFMAGTLQVARR